MFEPISTYWFSEQYNMFNSLSSEYIPSSVNESKASYSIGAGSSFAFRLLLVRLSSIIIVWFYEYTNTNKSFAILYPRFCRILHFESADFINFRLDCAPLMSLQVLLEANWEFDQMLSPVACENPPVRPLHATESIPEPCRKPVRAVPAPNCIGQIGKFRLWQLRTPVFTAVIQLSPSWTGIWVRVTHELSSAYSEKFIIQYFE